MYILIYTYTYICICVCTYSYMCICICCIYVHEQHGRYTPPNLSCNTIASIELDVSKRVPVLVNKFNRVAPG